MITKNELGKFERAIGFNLWQLEKDYLQHLTLAFLYERAGKELVFKGGTALQKCFGLDRFSIDLDFTGQLDKKILEGVAGDITKFGFEASLGKFTEKTEGITAILKINGPLYDGTIHSVATLQIDASQRENILLEPQIKEIIPQYTDLRPYIVALMASEEVLAEKVRATIWRAKARDVYDIWFLLQKGIRMRPRLIEQKLKYYDLEFSARQFIKKAEEIRKKWHTELGHLVRRVPDFDEVKKALQTAIKEL